MRCIFCRRPTPHRWAFTVSTGDAELLGPGSWSREVALACPRCHKLARDAGDNGLVVKATGERWLPGHGVGGYLGEPDTSQSPIHYRRYGGTLQGLATLRMMAG